MINFKRHRFPPAIIIMAVRWYLRYKLSLADITELLLERGVNVSREATREWVQKFGPQIAKTLNTKRRKIGKRWHVDETYVKVAGAWKYVYRTVDENMEPIDIYVSEKRDKRAAKKFFKKCIKVMGDAPESIRTDGHQGYEQVKEIFPDARHHKVKCLNNKEKVSFGPQNEAVSVSKYKEMLEELVLELTNNNPILQKIKSGANISDAETEEMATQLNQTHPHITESLLRNVYKNKKARFIQFIRHILGIEILARFPDTVVKAFDHFIADHTNLNSRQLEFLKLLKEFIIEREKVEKRDLIQSPFTVLHPQGIRGVFSPSEINEIIALTEKLDA